jgi:hypothetical protein
MNFRFFSKHGYFRFFSSLEDCLINHKLEGVKSPVEIFTTLGWLKNN